MDLNGFTFDPPAGFRTEELTVGLRMGTGNRPGPSFIIQSKPAREGATLDTNLNYGVSGAEHPFDSTFCMNGYITNTTVGLSPGGGSNFTGDVSGDGDNGSHFLYHYTGVGGTLCSNAIGDAAWRNTATINVVAGQVYEFSYYYRKQNTAGSATIIQQQIIPASGTITKLDSTNNPIVNASWVKIKMVFTPSANGPITLRLNNMLGAVGGNDFGIDNIALSVVPPTPTALNDTISSSCSMRSER